MLHGRESLEYVQVVETEPYEQLSHAAVAWVRENIQLCDVIHGHEWGGLLIDLATLDNYRQLKPGGADVAQQSLLFLALHFSKTASI